jgi:hypothetical protein
MEDNLTTHVIALELSLQDPSTRKDPAAIAELLSKDFREFGASGRIWDRAAILAELAAEISYPITSENLECRQLSSHLALLTYTASTPTRKTLRSSLWRLERYRWRVLFHQGTVVPPTL